MQSRILNDPLWGKLAELGKEYLSERGSGGQKDRLLKKSHKKFYDDFNIEIIFTRKAK